MTSLIVRRLLQMPLILIVIYTITFGLAWLIPGNPLEKGEGRRPPDEIVQAMREQYKLDSPWSFYWDYLGKATGVSWLIGVHDRPFDLGPSMTHENWSVNEILAAGLPVSITLGLAAIILACVIGLTAGVLGAVKPGSWLDFGTLVEVVSNRRLGRAFVHDVACHHAFAAVRSIHCALDALRHD
jgi:oligopeptide transport system permease protein